MVLSKLKAVPAAIRRRIPGGTPDLPGPDPSDVVPDAAPPLPDAVPVPDREALPSRDDLPEASGRDKLTLGLTLVTVVGALLAVGGAVARIVVKRRRQAETSVDIEVTDEGEEEAPEPTAPEPEYPKVAPLVGMAALVGMRLVVERLAGPTDDE
jgi:hypothetical protein